MLSGTARKRKGARQELKAKETLEALGYVVTKAGGSLGAWDIIAVHPTHVRLVQVKSNRRPGSMELETLRGFRVSSGISREVWVYHDGKSLPVVEVL